MAPPALLAVSTSRRLPGMPHVSALSEFFDGSEFAPATGVLAEAGLAPAIRRQLAQAIKEVSAESGPSVAYLAPASYAENLRDQPAEIAAAARLARIRPD
jgi:tripartite-type tricarboxylate transporter receptor subunit TctC